MSYRKISAILLCCVTVGLLIWFGERHAFQLLSSTNAGARGQATGNSSTASASNTSLVPAIPDRRLDNAIRRNGGRQSGIDDNGLGIYNESVRSLMRSNSIAKFDYGSFQLRNVCRSFLHGQDGLTATRTMMLLPLTDTADALVIGSATEAERLVGFQRSLDRCTKLFEGAAISQVRENGFLDALAAYSVFPTQLLSNSAPGTAIVAHSAQHQRNGQ